jgi:hypothetical protein
VSVGQDSSDFSDEAELVEICRLWDLADLISRLFSPCLYSDILKLSINSSSFDAIETLSQDFPLLKNVEFPVGQLLVDLHVTTATEHANGKEARGDKMTAVNLLKWYVSDKIKH